MSATEELAVQALNNAKLATKAQQKVQHLGELHELLVKSDPSLLGAYLPELIEFQVDKAASVKRRLLELLIAAVQVRNTPVVLSNVAPCIAGLLVVEHEQVQVAKQAAIATHIVLQAGMAMHRACPQGDAATDAAWAAVQHLQETVSSLASSSEADVALRVAAVKLSEQAVLLYTSAESARLPSAAALVTTADGLLRGMCDLLKEPGIAQLPGPVVICIFKALGAVAMHRGHLLGKVLPALLGPATKGIFKAPVPGDGQSCISASCGAALKDTLAHILRSNTDDTKPWQKRLETALRTMGADAVADSALRHIERAAARLKASLRANEKRKAAEQGGPDAKVPRSVTPAGANSSVENTPARTPTPVPAPSQQQQGGDDLLSMLLPGGIQRSADPTTDMQRVLEVLVEHQHSQAVETILAQISSDVLAELVLRWMPNLPAKPVSEPAAGQEAAATAAVQPIAGQPPAQAAAAPQQESAAAAPAATPPPAVKQEQEAAAAAGVLAAAAAQQQQQQQTVDPRRRAAAAGAAAAVVAAATNSTAAAALPLPSPLPSSLSTKQVQQMRYSAVQRILCAAKNRPIRNFRELLLSRLVSNTQQADDGLTGMMLHHVLEDYHGRRGHCLVLRWLYALAAALVAQSSGSDTAGAAAGAAGTSGTAAAASSRQEHKPAAAAAATDKDEDMQEADQQTSNGAQHQQQLQLQQDVDAHMQDAETNGTNLQQQQQQRIEQQQAGSSSISSNSAPSDLSGTQYETVLLAALQGLHEHLPSSDTAIAKLLQDAPVLPVNAVVNFLSQLVSQGAGWATLALDTAHSLIEARPPLRGDLLQLVLDSCTAADAVTREKAITSAVRQLMTWPMFAANIIEYAQAKLLLLLEPGKLMAEQQQDVEYDDQLVVKQEQPAEQQQHDQDQQVPDGSIESNAKQQQGGDAAQPGAEQQPDHVKQEQQQQQPVKQEQQEAELDVEVAAQHCMLFMSVCALKPQLMTVLLETYGKAGAAARTAMDRYASSLAHAIGPTNPELLNLIKAPPEGSRDLLLVMLHALVDAQLPPKQLLDACVASFAASKDAQLLAPVTVAMPKSDVIKLLPQLIAQLSKKELRLLYRKLTSTIADQPPHFQPGELLVALHQVKSTQALRVTTKQQTAAVDVALHAPEVFKLRDVSQAIRKLESMTPLPQLFMRTVISALQISPAMMDNVLELLKRLITKQIWSNEKQWQGFIICCEKGAPKTYPVLLQLPPNILEAALDRINERHWRELLKYATGPDCNVPVFQPVRDVLNLFLERLQSRQKAKLAAAAAAAGGGGSSSAANAGAGKATAKAAGATTVQKQQQGKAVVAAAKVHAGKSKAGLPTQPEQNSAASAVTAGNQTVDRGAQAAAGATGNQPQEQQQQHPPSGQQQSEENGGEDEFMLDFEDDE